MSLLKNIKYTIFLSVISIFVLSLIIIFFKYSRALFAKSNSYNYNYSSTAFYFDSEMRFSHTNNNYDGNSIPFKVYNYESDFQISKTNITYDIECIVDDVDNNFECYIDDTLDGVQNVSLNKSFTTSPANMTEEQCEASSTCTITYNKRYNVHNLKVKKLSTKKHVFVQINITTTSPYKKEFTTLYDITFDSSKSGVVINTIAERDNSCKYTITNYDENYSSIQLATANTNVRFCDSLSTTKTINLPVYTSNYLSVYKNSSISCQDAISVSN